MESYAELCLVASTFPEFMLVVTEDAIGLRVAQDATVPICSRILYVTDVRETSR